MSNTQNPNTTLSSEDEKCYTVYQNEFKNPVPTYVEELGLCLENFYNNNGTINPTMCVDNYNDKLASINMLNNSSLATSLNNLKNCILMNNTKPPTLAPISPEEPTDYSWIGWVVLAIVIIGVIGFVLWRIRAQMFRLSDVASTASSEKRDSASIPPDEPIVESVDAPVAVSKTREEIIIEGQRRGIAARAAAQIGEPVELK